MSRNIPYIRTLRTVSGLRTTKEKSETLIMGAISIKDIPGMYVPYVEKGINMVGVTIFMEFGQAVKFNYTSIIDRCRAPYRD